MKETFTKAFTEMSDAELDIMATAIHVEMTRRVNQRQEQKWDAVKKAIKDYINEFGIIEVETPDGETYYLEANDDYQSLGIIEQKGCY